jgi:hypothetical protein
LVCSSFMNFINEFKRGLSPAKMEGLTDHMWTWHESYSTIK